MNESERVREGERDIQGRGMRKVGREGRDNKDAITVSRCDKGK